MSDFSLYAAPLLGAAAAFAAAFVNAVAGGGTFIAFPTLNGVLGMTEKLANATCTVGLWPGYASSVAAARKDLAAIPRDALTRLVMLSLAGGAAGGAVLLLTPARASVPRRWCRFCSAIGHAAVCVRADHGQSPASIPTPCRIRRRAQRLPVIFVVALLQWLFRCGRWRARDGGVGALRNARRARREHLQDARAGDFQRRRGRGAGVVGNRITAGRTPGMMPGAIAGGWFGMRLANVIPREVSCVRSSSRAASA